MFSVRAQTLLVRVCPTPLNQLVSLKWCSFSSVILIYSDTSWFRIKEIRKNVLNADLFQYQDCSFWDFHITLINLGVSGANTRQSLILVLVTCFHGYYIQQPSTQTETRALDLLVSRGLAEKQKQCGLAFVLKCAKAHKVSFNIWAQQFEVRTHTQTKELIGNVFFLLIFFCYSFWFLLFHTKRVKQVLKPAGGILCSPPACLRSTAIAAKSSEVILCRSLCTYLAQITLSSSCKMINLRMWPQRNKHIPLISNDKINEYHLRKLYELCCS